MSTDSIIRGRYAPSPTGTLHLGNLRTALLAWLFARCQNGQFVLRVEDLDTQRVRQGATQYMLDDLRWLGLDWDEGPDCGGPYSPYTQSECVDRYIFCLQRLQEAGLVYPCYCSRAEISQAASAPQQGSEEGPRYPGTCRSLSQQRRHRLEAIGRRPSLRFRVPDDRIVTFTDSLAGEQTQHVQQSVGDFIIRRSDGIFAYQFAVVVDDGLMRINQVVRGSDLLSSTPRQILLFEALHFPLPTFIHVPLLLDEHGKRMAKREHSTGLAPLQQAGSSPEDAISLLAMGCGLINKGERAGTRELLQRYQKQQYDIMRSKLLLNK